jgi:cytochrome c5
VGGVLAAASLGLACGSGGSGGGGSSDSAQQSFESSVYPLIYPTCNQCHATGQDGAPIFLAPSASASYTVIDGTPGLIAAPQFSPLVQKGPHTGPALTMEQQMALTTWLDLEVKERGLSSVSTPQNLQAALAQFAACMDPAAWVANNMDKLATVTAGQSQCQSCHLRGLGGNFISGDTADTFNHFKKFPYVERLVVGTVDNKGAFARLVPSNRLLLKGTEKAQSPSTAHPAYSLPTAAEGPANDIADGVTNFVNQTLTRYMEPGSCSTIQQFDAGADADAGL